MPPPTPKPENIEIPDTQEAQSKTRKQRKRSADHRREEERQKKSAEEGTDQPGQEERTGIRTGMASARAWTPTEEADPSPEPPEFARRDPTPDEEVRRLDLEMRTPNPDAIPTPRNEGLTERVFDETATTPIPTPQAQEQPLPPVKTQPTQPVSISQETPEQKRTRTGERPDEEMPEAEQNKQALEEATRRMQEQELALAQAQEQIQALLQAQAAAAQAAQAQAQEQAQAQAQAQASAMQIEAQEQAGMPVPETQILHGAMQAARRQIEEMLARQNELDRRTSSLENNTKNIKDTQAGEQRMSRHTIAITRQKEKEQADKTYEVLGFPSDTTPSNINTQLDIIFEQSNIPKHAIMDIQKRDNPKTGKSTMVIHFRDVGSKKKIHTYFQTKHWTQTNTSGWQISGRWTLTRTALEQQIILNSIWNFIKETLGEAAVHSDTTGYYKDERIQAIRSKKTDWPMVQLSFEEVSTDPTVTIYVSEDMIQEAGQPYDDFKQKLHQWFDREQERQAQRRINEKANSSSSKAVPNPPNKLSEIQTPLAHWRRSIQKWSVLETREPDYVQKLAYNIKTLQSKGERGKGKGKKGQKGEKGEKGQGKTYKGEGKGESQKGTEKGKGKLTGKQALEASGWRPPAEWAEDASSGGNWWQSSSAASSSHTWNWWQ
jgi:hypothetical protein